MRNAEAGGGPGGGGGGAKPTPDCLVLLFGGAATPDCVEAAGAGGFGGRAVGGIEPGGGAGCVISAYRIDLSRNRQHPQTNKTISTHTNNSKIW